MTNPSNLVITGLDGYFILNFLQKSGYWKSRGGCPQGIGAGLLSQLFDCFDCHVDFLFFVEVRKTESYHT